MTNDVIDTTTDHTATAVPDIETEKQILVARFAAWADDHHYDSYLDSTARAIGLAEYLPDAPRSYTVDLAAFQALIPEQATILLHGNADAYDVANAVGAQLTDTIRQFKARIHGGLTEAVYVDSKAVDTAALSERWGNYSSPYPPSASEEGEQFRHQTIIAILKYSQGRYCDEVVEAIRNVGLGNYIPALSREVKFILPEDLREIDLTVELSRTGEFDPERFPRILADTLAAALAERGDDIIPAELRS